MAPSRPRAASFPASAPPALLPADLVTAAFNAIALAWWLPLLGRTPLAWGLATAHAAGLALPLLLLARRGPLPPALGALRELYPLLLVALVWSELGLRRPFVHTAWNNTYIETVDAAVFLGAPHRTWIRAQPGLLMSETMHGLYFAYYLLLVGVPLWLLATRRRAAVRDLALTTAAGYLACFTVYLLFPVDGPLHMHPPHTGPFTAGFFYGLTGAIRHAGDSLGTAFPSSHTAGSVTFALLAWRHGPRWLGLACALLAAGVAVSTVYTQNHFVTDAVAALLLMAAVHGWAVPALVRAHAAWRAARTRAGGREVLAAEPLAAEAA